MRTTFKRGHKIAWCMHADSPMLPQNSITMEEPPAPPPTSLLDLPDKALLTVLHCLAADSLSSLFSAARAHSTLHQLSAAALTSIDTAATQQQVASLQLYLSRHGQHVNSLQLRGYYTSDGEGLEDLDDPDSLVEHPLLNELPPSLQLHRLVLTNLQLQVQPDGGRAGVLQSGAPIKQLEISNCAMHGVNCPPDAAFAQALSQLPQLEHIKYTNWDGAPSFPGQVLSDLLLLTSLDVIYAPGDVLEFVHLAPGLRDLRARLTRASTTTSKLPVLGQLTSLQLEPVNAGEVCFDPADLANKGQLQRLDIQGASLAGGPAGVLALLSHLQQLTQLTQLELLLCWDLWAGPDVPYDPSGPPAAAYAALTASSTLQHLDVTGNTMPQGVWQHVLPADRQLPQLRVLKTSYCEPLGSWAHADTARLASYCPNLQELVMFALGPVAADVLHPLRDLAALTALEAGKLDDAGFAATAELTQLQQLTVWKQESATDAGLLQLTQLRQLSALVAFRGDLDATWKEACFEYKAAGDEPVWRQVGQHCMKSQQPGVAQLDSRWLPARRKLSLSACAGRLCGRVRAEGTC